MRLRAAAAVALAAGAALGVCATPASAAEDQAYAAALNYATPAVIAGQGDTLRFNNLDSIAQHDVVSDVPGQFSSPLIQGGQSSPVTGVDKLPPGQYAFHCSIHAWMHGQLTIAPAGGGGPPGPPQPPNSGSGPAPANPADLLPHVAPTPLGPGEWPFYGGDLSNSRAGGSSAPSYNEVVTMGPVWSFQSTDGDFTGTPVVAENTLVAGSGGGTVYALDPTTGKQRWSHPLKAPIVGSAAIAHGRVFVPLADPGKPRLAALRLSDGALEWETTIDTQKDADVYGSPVVWQAPLTSASKAKAKKKKHKRHRKNGAHRRRGNRAHDAASAARKGHARKHHRRKHRRKPRRHATAAPHRADTVYIGVSSLFGELNDPDVHTRGSVVALDAASGAIRWKTFTVPEGHDGGSVWSTPAIDTDTGRLYVGTGNAYHDPAADTTDSVLALDAAGGQIVGHLQGTAHDVWNGTSNAGAGPDYDFGASPNLFTDSTGRKLVGAGQKSGLYWAVDRATMKPVWTANTGPGTPVVGGIVGSTATEGHRVYGPDTPAGLLWGIGGDGSLAWESSDGGPVGFSAVSAGNGVVYSTTFSGHLTAREAGTGAILAQLPIGAPSWGGVSLAGGYVFAVTGTQGSGGWVTAYHPRG